MNESQQWRDAYAQAGAAAAHDCLEPDELLAAFAGGGASERVLRALAECPRCAALVQIARDLHEPLAAAAPRVVSAPARRPRARVLRWAASAAALLIVGLAALQLSRPVPDLTVRGAADSAAQPRSGSHLRTPPLQLAWAPVGTATAYRVEIYDERAESLWRSDRVEATTLQLPAELRARLVRGTFLWRVRAEGSEIEVGPFFFRVEP